MKSRPVIEKAREERESTSYLYRKDLNTIDRVNVKTMELLKK